MMGLAFDRLRLNGGNPLGELLALLDMYSRSQTLFTALSLALTPSPSPPWERGWG
ncbi:MAG: hypothetical protein RLZZ597_782 [Cyanobacteriota bacterium]|jgi:hypothetical protein